MTRASAALGRMSAAVPLLVAVLVLVGSGGHGGCVGPELTAASAPAGPAPLPHKPWSPPHPHFSAARAMTHAPGPGPLVVPVAARAPWPTEIPARPAPRVAGPAAPPTDLAVLQVFRL